MKTKPCGLKTEVFSRVCGYYRPTENWNKGKKAEFNERKHYNVEKAKKTIEKEQAVND